MLNLLLSEKNTSALELLDHQLGARAHDVFANKRRKGLLPRPLYNLIREAALVVNGTTQVIHWNALCQEGVVVVVSVTWGGVDQASSRFGRDIVRRKDCWPGCSVASVEEIAVLGADKVPALR